VRINADYYPNTAKQYHIKTLPTTIVLAPTAQGEVLDVIPQRIPLDQYLSRLNRVADDSRRRNGAVAQLASANPQRSAAAPITPANPPVVNIPAAQNGISIPVTNPATNQAANDARRPAAPFYPMCLDGFCPVRLAENHVWTPGQKAWGAVHRGRTYLFAGEEERRRFMADPDRYAPVLSGGDIVAQLEQGRALQGSREHGSQYAGHVYLFADESNLARFMANPNFYAERVQEAARTSEQAAASMR
jgi:YHS domain-containing protein